MTLGRSQQQRVSNVVCSNVYLCTTTSLSRQPHKMPTMIQIISGGEQLRHLLYRVFSTHARHAAVISSSIGEQDLSETAGFDKRTYSEVTKCTQHPAEAVSDGRGSCNPWEQQQWKGFLALQQEIQSKFLHSQQGFCPAFLWHYTLMYSRMAARWMARNRIIKPHLLTQVSNRIMR